MTFVTVVIVVSVVPVVTFVTGVTLLIVVCCDFCDWCDSFDSNDYCDCCKCCKCCDCSLLLLGSVSGQEIIAMSGYNTINSRDREQIKIPPQSVRCLCLLITETHCDVGLMSRVTPETSLMSNAVP